MNDAGLGTTYMDTEGHEFTSTMGEEIVHTYDGDRLPDWPDDEIERYWSVPEPASLFPGGRPARATSAPEPCSARVRGEGRDRRDCFLRREPFRIEDEVGGRDRGDITFDPVVVGPQERRVPGDTPR